MPDNSYRRALIGAILFHLLLGCLLIVEFHQSSPVLIKESENQTGELMVKQESEPAKQEIVKAVSVDNQDLMQAVNHLKEERQKKISAERAHQKALDNQAEAAKQERLQEQQRLAKLKEDAANLVLERQKQLKEEQERLKQLAVEIGRASCRERVCQYV